MDLIHNVTELLFDEIEDNRNNDYRLALKWAWRIIETHERDNVYFLFQSEIDRAKWLATQANTRDQDVRTVFPSYDWQDGISTALRIWNREHDKYNAYWASHKEQLIDETEEVPF
jgi:hypothetical protein